MRRAKEVKVINRWKANDFDGELPIGGEDEEMVGTAMKMANGVGQLQGIVADSMPVVQPMTWFDFYGTQIKTEIDKDRTYKLMYFATWFTCINYVINFFVYASKCSNPNSKPFNFAFFS